MTIRYFSLAMATAFICILCSQSQAQTPRMTTVNITPDTNQVHITAVGDATEMRVEISDEAGDVVFQSGAITGQTLDWNMKDSAGERVAAGTYLVTVTFRTPSGKIRKRVEQVTVDEAEQASAKVPPVAPEAVEATVTTSGTTTTGKIAKFASASTVTNSIVTESAGKIGINAASPVSRLHIVSASTDKPPRLQSAGTTSFAAGWDFYQGTTPKGYVGVPGTDVSGPGPGEMLLYGSTGVKTSLWAGGARAATILTNGNVGIGTLSPSYRLHVIGGSIGVYGEGSSGTGVYGKGINGVYGVGSNGFGVAGDSTSGYGVYGNSGSGYAGYFNGKAKVTDNLEVGSCTGCTISSDQHLKTNFAAVNPSSILNRLAALPIRQWNYKRDDSSIRHIGAMAQDFRAAFNLGVDDKHIDMIDMGGVTMASIQALYQMMQEKDRQIERLQAQVTQLQRTVRKKRARQ